jgi:hypothetical protein
LKYFLLKIKNVRCNHQIKHDLREMQSQNINLAGEMRKIEDKKNRMEEKARKEKNRAEKEMRKQVKLLEKENQRKEKADKKKEKQLLKEIAILERGRDQRRIQVEKEKAKIVKENDKKEKETKRKRKQEITRFAIGKMLLTASALSQIHPNGFYARDLTNKYVEMHGNINPYTLEAADDKYDTHAAIRGFMYETSPSSTQHWFRYGIKKVREEIAPWIFVNKELAIVNNSFEWKVSTKEMKKMQRHDKGKWKLLPGGSQAYYLWSDEMYGPMPTEEQLETAKQSRKRGVRRGKQDNSCVQEVPVPADRRHK